MSVTVITINRPDRDPDFDLVLAKISKLSPREISERSGGLVGAGTIRGWRNKKVRKPLHYTMQGALRAAGFEYRIMRRRAD